MKTIIATILFLTSSFLISSEIDSSNNESIFKVKEKTLGIELGASLPELISLGIRAHFIKNVYFSFRFGGDVGGGDTKHSAIEFDNDVFSSELSFYFGEVSKNFEYGSWNFGIAYAQEDRAFLCLWDDNCENDRYYTTFRIGKDFHLIDKLYLQTGLGLSLMRIQDETGTSLLPAAKVSLLYWFW